MVRNGNGTKWLWYENDFHNGTKWLVRNDCNSDCIRGYLQGSENGRVVTIDADRHIMTISYHMQINTLYDHIVPYAVRYNRWPFRLHIVFGWVLHWQILCRHYSNEWVLFTLNVTAILAWCNAWHWMHMNNAWNIMFPHVHDLDYWLTVRMQDLLEAVSYLFWFNCCCMPLYLTCSRIKWMNKGSHH
jgi:hypothetical protein